MKAIRKDRLEAGKKMNHLCEWFYNPLKGQPRYLDINYLRRLAKQPEILMEINYIKNEISASPWRVTGPKRWVKYATQFLNDCNLNHENLSTLLSQLVEDSLVLDAMVLVKGFTAESYRKQKTGAYELKKRGRRHLLEIWARDAGSFLKEVDVSGVLYRYWQFSYLHDKVAPVEFSVDEIAYGIRHPLSYKVYGHSELESYHNPTFLNKLLHRTRDYIYSHTTEKELKRLIEQLLTTRILSEFNPKLKFQFVK